ncbi:MAG: hypothetical protein GY749_07985 [Desulfobacteraceae bacterium]|nr:hypothetical protein [Desulfobacteraceae bacterium]
MSKKFAKLFFAVLAASVINFSVAYAADWVSVSGQVKTQDGTLLCAMVLANGQHMFTCADEGEYSMSVPLNDDDQIIFYAFCEGFMPFKQILDRDQNQFDVTMSVCGSSGTDTCENIEGSWTDYVTGSMIITVLGNTQTEPFEGGRAISVGQDNCNTEWNFSDAGMSYKRTGTINGNVITLSGDAIDADTYATKVEEGLKEQYDMDATVNFTSNTHSGEGTFAEDKITYNGTGNMLGTVTMVTGTLDISVSVTENSTLTRSVSRRDSSMEVSPAQLLTDFLAETLRAEFD